MQNPQQPKNVIVILADDLGWGELGCYGSTQTRTPAIDRLAERGALFTDAHATSSLCTPSRYSLLTGRYAWRSPLRYGLLGPHSPAIIGPDRPTLGTLLRNAGFSTAAFGKWHLGLGWVRRDGHVDNAFDMDWRDLLWDGRKPSSDTGEDVDYGVPFTDGPLDHGFDRFFGISGSLDMPPYCFLEDRTTVGVPDIPRTERNPGQRFGYTVPEWRDQDVDPRFLHEATAWIVDHADERKFVYLATAAPHRPHVPPAFIQGTSSGGPRGDAVELVDWVVDHMVRCLEDLGQLDDSLIILSSDNGAPQPRDGETRGDYAPNGRLRGQKADVWEGGHREPLIICWPGVVPAGTRFDTPVSLSDVFPTMAELFPMPTDSQADGRSLLPILLGDKDVDAGRVFVYQGGEGVYAVRRGAEKAVFTSGSGGYSEPTGEAQYPGDAHGQLYDLAADLPERNNLWHARADSAHELFTELIKTGARLRPHEAPTGEGSPL